MERETSLLETDFYQLTMSQGYFDHNKHNDKAHFRMYFRNGALQEKGALICGFEPLFDYLESFNFTDKELEYLSGIKNCIGEALFSDAFLSFLKEARFDCDLYAVEEGTYLFPNQPILNIEGPLWQCQLIETITLNIINYSSLIASKARIICDAAQGGPVLDFGMRRAHGPNGACLASRAAYIGGCAGTSNVKAGMKYGIPVKGTHSHSWVMAFADEKTSFEAFAKSFPDACILLIDTYESMEGLENAISIGKDLKANGKELKAVRLDSGDLLGLSKKVRRRLDEAGLSTTKIIVSDELDEYKIRGLIEAGAPIDMWGVGTKLATGKPDNTLGGVYKLSAIKEGNGSWLPKYKISNDPHKTSLVGRWSLSRFWKGDRWVGDQMISLDEEAPIDFFIQEEGEKEELLKKVFEKGKRIKPKLSLDEIRSHALSQNVKIRQPSLQFS